ncbi:MAG: helix-turn-helix domain-containing protein, partial [Lachnoclostridium sp.]|nr:helix-turn-helix domain-containing protein [Lachnoclostridium sp.]
GREVIEKAEAFRPDIAVMDIHMPGISGMNAIEEIKKDNNSTIFIVMSAYDKFEYAQKAIDLGVMEFLTKPSNPKKVIHTLAHAFHMIEEKRMKRKSSLEIKEKMGIIVPIIESGLVYTILFHDDFTGDSENFQSLLGIKSRWGYIMILEFANEMRDGILVNPIGTSVDLGKNYRSVREIIKEFFTCVIGTVMSNRIIVYVPENETSDSYTGRVKVINRARDLSKKLYHKTDMFARIGIGAVKEMTQAKESYIDANKALRYMRGTVSHIEDLIMEEKSEENYPRNIELNMFAMLKKGDLTKLLIEANHFYDWMIDNYHEYEMDVKLKVLEMVLVLEREAFITGQMAYHFRDRSEYMETIVDIHDYEKLRTWFLGKITIACNHISITRKDGYSEMITKAKEYIDANFHNEISLDEVSKKADISPYYFSKVFKDETGENFMKYLTNIRIEKAKELLSDANNSIKEVCLSVGYGDPNYFSRIFKKTVGVTPTEYRGERS